eukprot:6546559-Prorocentrum_lima.AAC.1
MIRLVLDVAEEKNMKMNLAKSLVLVSWRGKGKREDERRAIRQDKKQDFGRLAGIKIDRTAK